MRPLIDADELAALLGVSRSRLYAWRHAGKGPPAIALHSRMLRFRPEAVEAWLQEQEQESQNAAT